MGTIWIKEFTGGLDTRRMPETTAGGVLIVAKDGHVTRGGEFEKRAAFVPTYDLPLNVTKSLARTGAGVVVFGSGSAPALPAGVTYQQLQHSDGVTPLDQVLSSDIYAGKLYVAARFTDGTVFHFYDGIRVTDWANGQAGASFDVINGTGTSTITNMTINGIEMLGATVTWTTSNANTASLIAAQINTFVSAPEYTATVNGATVNIKAAIADASINDAPVVFTVTNALGLSPSSGLTMSGGQDPADVVPPGNFVKTYGSREMSVSRSLLFGSGIGQPTAWNTDTVGAFFIDMTAQTSDADELVAFAEYQNLIAVFSERVILTWFIDSDPANNRKSQVLRNTGTASPKSVTQFGDQDLFYLDESGIRSLKARDASNAAATSDIGVPVDDIVTAKLQLLTDAERQLIIGQIEPSGGRFWLIMKDIIYVFSYFPGSKVSAWSTYVPGFNVSDAVVYNRRVYLRSGDTIYVYGGLGDDTEYDETVAEAWPPYLDGGSPTEIKTLTGIDVACIGLWNISIATDPINSDAEDQIANVTETTYTLRSIPEMGQSTHLQPRLRSSGPGYCKMAAVVMHYQGAPPDED